MPAVRLGAPLRLFWRAHRLFMRATGARFGLFNVLVGRYFLSGMPVLLLTTRGHRSGVRRDVALSYFRSDGDYVVIGSYVGEDRDPAWWKNLRAHPDATIAVDGRTLRVRAREAEGARRELLWAEVVRRNAAYAEYQRRTTRRIPVVILEPLAAPSRSTSA